MPKPNTPLQSLIDESNRPPRLPAMTAREMKAESVRLHLAFADLMARTVIHVGSEQAIKILQRAATVIATEARKNGHSPAREATS